MSGEAYFEDGLALLTAALAMALSLAVWNLCVCQRRLTKARAVRTLLWGAIEEAPTFFSLFTARGDLVLCNESFRSVNDGIFDVKRRSLNFADLIRDVLRPNVAPDRLEEEVAAAMRRHFAPGASELDRKYPDGRWHRVMRRPLSTGHVFAFGLDVTSLKVRESAIAHSVDWFEREACALSEALSAQATHLRDTAVTVAASAASSTGRANAVTMATRETAGHVAKAAEASGRLAISIASIDGEVRHSVNATERAAIGARHAECVVHDLAASARSVGSVVGLIGQIAGQTNLLALNASIEAARAGVAGQGFGVVAVEVKALARQTRQATQEAGNHIQAIRLATQQAVTAIGAITSMVDAVDASASTVAGVVGHQGSMTTDIARTIYATLGSTDLVLAEISGVSASAGEISVAADAVLKAATLIADQAAGFSARVDTFVAQIRAA